MDNASSVSHFLLLEFSEVRDLQIIHAFVFLTLYMATVSGNLLIILAIVLNHRLHTPMYFFLMNLAILDIGSISVTIPKSMVNSLLNTRLISYSGCVAQVFFLLFFVASDFALLTVMAHDRYVAICNPLRYETIMNKVACMRMIVSSCVSGLFYAVMHTTCTFVNSFCSNVVDQYFCEIPQLLMLSCSDLYLVEIGVLVFSVAVVFSCFIFISITYVVIFTTVVRIPSAQGRQKAFSTCLPHLIVVSVFVFTGSFVYLLPSSSSLSDLRLVCAIIYSVVPPLMNPLIYSLRNKEIKSALWKLLT
ncbi:olfactory receptor 14C36-like [Varanus komodoensis]|uniref:G-protein coupled receptors family 1 profile domain-containing protein n=1 Tax=Varanus komodoensis TaxID=61221 RepID=A0A8D2Q3H1_VARKO|nr:olfactory receptor 14C36-like [Varanus komodoensis]